VQDATQHEAGNPPSQARSESVARTSTTSRLARMRYCGFRRSRPGIPNVFRAPFQSDAAHQSNLMAPRVVSSRRPVAVIS
jgi:hypothetical protein